MLCCGMAKKTKSSQRSAGVALGRQDFAKIGAVEGTRLSNGQNEDLGDFGRKALTSKTRRAVPAAKSSTKRLGLAKGKFKFPHDIDTENAAITKLFKGNAR